MRKNIRFENCVEMVGFRLEDYSLSEEKANNDNERFVNTGSNIERIVEDDNPLTANYRFKEREEREFTRR